MLMTPFISWTYDHTSARLALAEAAIEAAARLRPDAGETHLARAQNLYSGYLDYDDALAELEVARHTLPNDFRVSRLMGHHPEASGTLGRIHAKSRARGGAQPARPRQQDRRLQSNYTFLRRYADLKSALASTLAVFPNNLNMAGMADVRGTSGKSRHRPVASDPRFNSNHKSRCNAGYR